MKKYASPCLFRARAEFLEHQYHNQLHYYTSLHIITRYSFSLHHIITRFDPLLHLYKSLLHTITRFITHAFMFYYTWVGSYYTWVGSYYTLITRSHASYYTLPWFLLHAPMILITRSHDSYHTLPWFLLHALIFLLHETHSYYTRCVIACNKTLLHAITRYVKVPDERWGAAGQRHWE